MDALTEAVERKGERMNHNLKISPKYFNDVVYYNKRFELRKDDRNYQVGDTLLLEEYEDGEYTGRCFSPIRPIQYILRDCEEYGLQKGYCILGW